MEWFNSCPTKFQGNKWANHVNCLWSGVILISDRLQLYIIHFQVVLFFLELHLLERSQLQLYCDFWKFFISPYLGDSHFGCLSYPSIFQKQFVPQIRIWDKALGYQIHICILSIKPCPSPSFFSLWYTVPFSLW